MTCKKASFHLMHISTRNRPPSELSQTKDL